MANIIRIPKFLMLVIVAWITIQQEAPQAWNIFACRILVKKRV